MQILIRRGRTADADAAIATLRRSITELCGQDHQGEAGALAAWLGNKTVATWGAWIARKDAVVLVAERAGSIAGGGMADLCGTILLNYVHPDARFSGVSKAMLTALENGSRRQGNRACRLESTKTARAFYERCGYLPEGDNPFQLSKAL